MSFEEYRLLSDGAWAIDPSEFKEAFLVVTQAYQNLDQFDVSQYKVNVLDSNGFLKPVQIEDTPINRVLLALRDWYHEESVEKYISISWRIISLSRLIRTGVLDDWINNSPTDKSLVIPGEVIYVAATIPLDDIEGFDPFLFSQALQEVSTDGSTDINL